MKALGNRTIELMVLFLMGALIVVSYFPSFENLPMRDSGNFLYGGQSILSGGIPYVDAWDHKPPVVLYLNALGLLIGQGSRFGVVLIEIIFVFMSSVLSYSALKRVFGLFPACFGTFGWILSLNSIFLYGNFVELYALLFQFAALYCFVKANENDFPWGYSVAIGVLFALSFMTRQNIIGIWAAIFFYLIWECFSSKLFKEYLSRVFFAFIGFSVVISAICIYFWSRGALYELWDVAFKYNFIYSSGSTLSARIQSVSTGISNISFMPYILGAWIVSCLFLWNSLIQKKEVATLIKVSVVALPIEIALTALSGNHYLHYYISWLPVLSVFLAFIPWIIQKVLQSKLSENIAIKNCLRINLRQVIAIVFVLVLLQKSVFFLNTLKKSLDNSKRSHPVLEYLNQHKSVEDRLLGWGMDGDFNFLTGLKSPSRFFYQRALITEGYTSEELIESFVGDLETNAPQYILDSPNQFMPPLNRRMREDWNMEYFLVFKKHLDLPKNFDEIYGFIERNYSVEEIIGAWVIYKKKE
jgi:4-amino-4-deoxy-L-arabinose transferase-like glycosyltransferase